jgi:DNA (cytosine-5)-methyltransferase 1
MNEIKILELFGGIGAPRIALRNIGVPVKSIDYVEVDEKAVRTYNALFPEELEYKKQDIVGWDLKPDILIHGSPCQDFSIAGQKLGGDEGSGTRSSLMWETLNIIEKMGGWKPKIVVWENVRGVLSKKMKHNFNKYIERMNKLGYSSSYEVLDARDFGLPQARERVFVVSILNGKEFDFSLLKKKTMRNIEEFIEKEVDEHYTVTQKSMLSKINQTEKPEGGFTGKVSVIKEYAYTILCKQMRCPNSGVIDLENGQYRYLTERECWRLQGFTDKDFDAALEVHPGKNGCLNGALYKQAGNAMPVAVLESIFELLLDKYLK